MPTQGQIAIALLHDLALIYLGLAHGADDDLDPAESTTIAAKLRRWQPDKDPALIDHVIREATLSYLNGSKTDRIAEAIANLRGELDVHLRQAILDDLNEIAKADGQVIEGENLFIQRIADAWTVTPH